MHGMYNFKTDYFVLFCSSYSNYYKPVSTSETLKLIFLLLGFPKSRCLSGPYILCRYMLMLLVNCLASYLLVTRRRVTCIIDSTLLNNLRSN